MAQILIVDDEPRICRLVSRALERDGHVVTEAGTGTAALRLAATEDFALILLDLMLPGVGGLDVLRHLTAARPDQRVMILSAIGDISARLACFSDGAIDYLAKPFVLAELTARVRLRVWEPGAGAALHWLRVGKISLDLQRRIAAVEGQSIPLSQREFLLLSHLMRRAGRVCRRDELLAQVWGYTFDTPSNVVDVYVRRLRAKLNPDSIETVRNVGYCFVAA
jgi:two-component system OmpR family response regulator